MPLTPGYEPGHSDIRASDHTTRIIACATMWHENNDEMKEFLKSVMRLDEDQCARRITQTYLHIRDPDFYEYESEFIVDVDNLQSILIATVLLFFVCIKSTIFSNINLILELLHLQMYRRYILSILSFFNDRKG